MGVDFQLLAKFERTLSSPDAILQELETWVLEYARDLAPSTRIGFSETQPTLFCQLHPAAEELELSLIDMDHLAACARTSTVGPGYHIFLCDMLKSLGEAFRLAWVTDNEEYFDETDYFFSADPEKVFDEMTSWLRALAGLFFDGTFEPEPEDMPTVLCLPIGTAFEAAAPAITPLGPRDLAWLKKVAKDGTQGRDFFAWWKAGLNAEYFLGRALCRMWTEVRWRRPINDSEREALKYVADSLETAFKLEQNLGYPWAEWAQILDFLEIEDPELEFVGLRAMDVPQKAVPQIGYRRRNVVVTLPGYWTVNVPGSFSDFDPDDEGDFSAQDPPRTIWFTSYTFVEDPAKMFAQARKEILAKESSLFEERKAYIARADINAHNDEEERYFVLTSSNACPKGRSVLSVVFSDPEDQPWAEEVWRSLQPPPDGE